MHSKNKYLPAQSEALSVYSSGPHVLNETVPQRGGCCEMVEEHAPRRGYLSVRPLGTSSALSSSHWDDGQYIDPSHDKEFTSSDISLVQRKASSVTSYRSVASLAPSSLRYVGIRQMRDRSPVELLSSSTALKPQHSVAPQRGPVSEPITVQNCLPTPQRSPVGHPERESSSHFEIHSANPPDHSREPLSASLHPLLRQALLLITAAEIGDRLLICQGEADAFDTILSSFSVAKEVEAVRVAAFNMFELEADARHALYAQQKRERCVLWYCYREDYNSAVLSGEVRAIQLGEAQVVYKQAESLLRSRSTSLQQHSSELLDPKARQRELPQSRQIVPSTITTQDGTQKVTTSPKHQLSYPTSSSLKSVSPVRRSPDSESRPTGTSSSSSYSVLTASSPVRADRISSRTTELLDVGGERAMPWSEDGSAVIKTALDDRFARQQLLLASGGTALSMFAPPFFPTRRAPKRPVL